jgi:hypothetical protein
MAATTWLRRAGTARSAAPALVLAAGSVVVKVEEDGAVALGAPGVLPRQHHVHHAPGAPRQDHRHADAGLRAALRRHARARRRRCRRRRRREPPRRAAAAHGVRRRRPPRATARP